MDLNFQWTITSEERASILSKMKPMFNLATNSSPAPDQFIFKSPILPDDKKKSSSSWYLEITSGEHCYIQLKLCLASIEKFGPIRVTYKLSFKTMVERASHESNEVLDIPKISKISLPDKFLNALYFMGLASTNYDLHFVCSIKVCDVPGSNDILAYMQTDYEKLLEDTKYSDFMLLTSTKKFNVHKNILAARSDVFSAMFEHDMKETKEGFAEIKEFDDRIIQEFLRYIYCGKVENLNELAKDLLVAAEKYLILDLKVVCLEEICKTINIENAVELLSLVDSHNVEHLRSSVIDFIVQNIKDCTIKSNLDSIENVKLSNEILCRTINKYL